MYAVVDVETTGLNPGWRHRIAEVAVVLIDERGRVEQEWCSLVNPGRDLGRQDIHGIRAADVRRAPTFRELAYQIAQLLVGRVVVAHNLSFDAMFLRHEYDLLGIDVPLSNDLGLCTMGLAARYLPSSGRSLRDCCMAAGIRSDEWHSALSDAKAAAKLFAVYLSAAPNPPPWSSLLSTASHLRWPLLPHLAVAPVTRSARRSNEQHFLSRLVDRLPRVPQPPQADTYLAVLDRALIDRHISDSEADELIALAGDFGLNRTEVTELHHTYLCALAHTALEDGIVTDEERHDLETVARLLGLGSDVTDAVLTATTHDAPHDRRSVSRLGQFRLQLGDAIVLTGQMDEPREVWENRARAAGLDVSGRTVTKKTRLLVAADPDSLSGKARKARDYGIPIVTEEGFGQLLAALRAHNKQVGERT